MFRHLRISFYIDRKPSVASGDLVHTIFCMNYGVENRDESVCTTHNE